VTGADVIVIVWLTLSALVGLRRGFAAQVLALAGFAAGAWLAEPELHAPTRIVRPANAPSTRSFVFIFSVSPPEIRWTAGGAGCWSSARCGAGRSFATLRPVGPRPALTSV